MLILLVEPNPRQRRKLSRALTLEDYSVRTARDSRAAVRLFLAYQAAVASRPAPLVSDDFNGDDGL